MRLSRSRIFKKLEEPECAFLIGSLPFACA